MKLDPHTYQIIASAVYDATINTPEARKPGEGKRFNNHPAYLWVRDNLTSVANAYQDETEEQAIANLSRRLEALERRVVLNKWPSTERVSCWIK